jgi:hypothetical protein
MRNLFKSAIIVMAISIVGFKFSEVKSQTTICEKMGITERETGIVYCLGVGFTTCIVACPQQ